MRTREERRALLAAVIEDPAASHGDRLRADQALADLELLDRAATSDDASLTPEQVREELASLAAMCTAALAVDAGPDAVEPPEPEDPPQQVDPLEIIDLLLSINQSLEGRLARAETDLSWWTRHRQLSASGSLVTT